MDIGQGEQANSNLWSDREHDKFFIISHVPRICARENRHNPGLTLTVSHFSSFALKAIFILLLRERGSSFQASVIRYNDLNIRMLLNRNNLLIRNKLLNRNNEKNLAVVECDEQREPYMYRVLSFAGAHSVERNNIVI